MSAPSRTLAVLAYHKVGPPAAGSWETWFSVSEDTFASHLEYLEENDWQVIGLDDLLGAIENPATLGKRSALLTFDDGERSLYGLAARVLSRFGFPSVCFLPTDFIGRASVFNLDDGEPEEPICEADALRELAGRRVSIQSHGASHTRFSLLDGGQQQRELLRSKAAIEAVVDRPVRAFAFPYGDVGRNGHGLDAALHRSGYRAAFLYGGGPVALPVANRYRIPRIPMGPDTDLHKELGGR
jgi:peptidoglycan/xylan/chitin deacetylase (PgdA/CDA1 family)